MVLPPQTIDLGGQYVPRLYPTDTQRLRKTSTSKAENKIYLHFAFTLSAMLSTFPVRLCNHPPPSPKRYFEPSRADKHPRLSAPPHPPHIPWKASVLEKKSRKYENNGFQAFGFEKK